MRVLNIPHFQCSKCFASYEGTILPNKIDVVFVHVSVLEDEKKCEDRARKFTQSLSQFSVEVI